MKIAVIVNSFPSLSEKFILQQIISLLNQGINLDIYAAVAAKQEKTHEIFNSFDFKNIVHCLNIPLKAWKRFFYFPSFILCFLKNPLFFIKSFSFKKYNTSAINLKNIFFLKYLLNKKYDIIHAHFGQNGLTGSFLKNCNIGKKLIVTFHGTDITSTPNKFGSDMYEYMFKTADILTAGSNFIKNKLIAHGCDQNKIQIIPMGINPKTHISFTHDNYFLSVGRLVEVKGFIYAIEAFAILAEKVQNIKYFIVGHGPLFESLNKRIVQLGLENRIFLIGEKTDKELESLFAKAFVFIIPSIRASDGAEEGQGLVVQEAESYALPVIATNVGGISDGIIPGKTGFLVPEKDSRAIYEKMLYYIDNPDKRLEFGKAGRQFVEQNYDIALLTKKLINVYSSLYTPNTIDTNEIQN
jgi:colanic acid/amylovoran biosynthesis glycosyltransferase